MLAALLPRHKRTLPVARPYQEEAVSAISRDWEEGILRVLSVLPGGAGKSTIAGFLIDKEVLESGRVLILADRKKLIRQFCRRIELDFGLATSIEMANEKEDGTSVVGASIQTMARRIAQGKFHPEDFTLLVMDEAHLSLSPAWQAIAKHFSKARILGLTATPRASGQKDLFQFFESKAIDIPIARLWDEKWLAPLDTLNIPLSIPLEKTNNKDWADEEIDHCIEPYLDRCADWMAESKDAKGRCSLAFLPLITTSQKFTNKLNARGLRAMHVDGTMDEDEVTNITDRLAKGQLDCVCSSLLLSVGVDIKPVNLVLNLRPTKSWVLYCQIAYRGTRLYDPAEDEPGWPLKSNCLLVDPLWQCDDHNLQQPPDIIAKDEEEAEGMKELIRTGGGKPQGLLKVQSTFRHAKEIATAKLLAEMSKRRERLISAKDYHLMMGADYSPRHKWEYDPIYPIQRDQLMMMDVDLQTVSNAGEANRIIQALTSDRKKTGQGSYKASRYALTLGMQNAMTASRQDVSDWIETHK